MPVFARLAPLPCVLALVFASVPSAQAAESYDNCTGFIDSLPATISTQGVWCLRGNLVTSMSSGNAITIAGNNITIDCNDFKIGGLPAGEWTDTYGIDAHYRLNTTVRNCGIRGFFLAVNLVGGGGHLVEGNRIDQSWFGAVQVFGEGNIVRDNRVFDTGGRPGATQAIAMYGSAHFIGNTIHSVYANGPDSLVVGIQSTESGTEVRDNRVTGLLASGAGFSTTIGFLAAADGISYHGNFASADSASGQIYGIQGTNSSYCSDNRMTGFTSGAIGCGFRDGNLPAGL